MSNLSSLDIENFYMKLNDLDEEYEKYINDKNNKQNVSLVSEFKTNKYFHIMLTKILHYFFGDKIMFTPNYNTYIHNGNIIPTELIIENDYILFTLNFDSNTLITSKQHKSSKKAKTKYFTYIIANNLIQMNTKFIDFLYIIKITEEEDNSSLENLARKTIKENNIPIMPTSYRTKDEIEYIVSLPRPSKKGGNRTTKKKNHRHKIEIK
jgi:hypothetical protein